MIITYLKGLHKTALLLPSKKGIFAIDAVDASPIIFWDHDAQGTKYLHELSHA